MEREQCRGAHGLSIRTYMRLSASGNPLLRRSDRIQFWVSVLLMALLAVGLPAASLSAGWAAYGSQMHTARVQAAQRHQVSARLTGEPTDMGTGKQFGRVRWTAKDGTERTAVTRVERGTPQGANVKVWVNRHGDLVEAPLRPAVARTTGWIAGSITAGAVALIVLNVRRGISCAMDRRRHTQWGAEWDRMEPRWPRGLP
ncbi:hypothetical protein [Streptomyces sp. RTd22]|uniref:Rv1733c family protein n=1 Tax=Streptomyces sp. RTd22 TaxID=1841249 RepID=UPI00131E63B7|nr:hypothetical protein [Streptomyces sp. RTd22]